MNLWNGSLYTQDDNKAFGLTYVFPYEACIALATQNWNEVNGFLAMSFSVVIRDPECPEDEKVVCRGDPPMSVERAVRLCNKNTTWVRFKFH